MFASFDHRQEGERHDDGAPSKPQDHLPLHRLEQSRKGEMSPRRQLFRVAFVVLLSLLILNQAVLIVYVQLGVVLPTRRGTGSSIVTTSLGGELAHSVSLAFCRRSSLIFPYGAAAAGAAAGEARAHGIQLTIPVDYQCAGESYENFTSQYLMPYAKEVARNSSWGRRSFPLPGNASILVLGNSHTKQTVIALLCQYADAVQSVTPLGPSDVHLRNIGYFFEARFVNNASMVFLVNHPLVYSRSWAENIRRFDPQRRRLSGYDAVVLGQFNRYDPRFLNSLLFSMLLAFQHRHPSLIDLEHDSCPSLVDVAGRYNKSIVVLPMFASFARAWTEQVIEVARGLRMNQNRSNIGVVRTRGHIRAMGVECGSSANRTSIGACMDISGAHRCAGPSGGDADLMAWDLIESLHGAIR